MIDPKTKFFENDFSCVKNWFILGDNLGMKGRSQQGFIQAILMTGRHHKKLNLMSFETQSSKNFN